jgi:peptidoglycan/xylan/chitin deacetylase (PgdA/CDA1 family)
MRALVKSAVFGASIFVRRRFDRGCATLLNYHRFPFEDAASFRRQCEYLSKRCCVIPMSELAAALRDGRPLPAHAAVITVDDGRRDFYTCAYPILREFGLTAVMYLPTAFLDGAWLWFDRYQYIFDRSPLKRAECRGVAPLTDASLDLSSRDARYRTFLEIAQQAQWMPAAGRDQLGDRLAELLRVSIPDRPPEEFAPLRWDEVREMARNGIEFGGHTVTHPILQTVASADSLSREIEGCKARIEDELQAPVRHFAYPSGKTEEIPAAAKEAVAHAGFETAVTTLPGQARPGDDPLWLRRNGIDPGADLLWFRRCVAAVKVNGP